MNWDLSSYFTEFNGPEMNSFKEALKDEIESTKTRAQGLTALDDGNMPEWEDVFLTNEDLEKRFSHLTSYVGCLSAADSRNEAYLKEEAETSLLGAEFKKLEVELLRGIKGVSSENFEQFIKRDKLQSCSYFIRRMREEASWMMSTVGEVLAADLAVDGINAWGRLYDTLSGKLMFEMEYPDGTKETLSISSRRSLMERPDRRLRKAAFEKGNEAWETVEDSACAALNAISGTRLTLNKHRGVEHFLDIALFQSALTKKTLDAMFEAIYSEIELPRRILRSKAKSMGRETVAWYDLGAELPIKDQKTIDWDEAKRLVHSSFAGSYPKLGEFTASMYEKEWLDWEPREGKRPGGFCTGSLLTGESRIFMTYKESLGDVLTLAHEAGHAFHSHLMRGMRPYTQFYPMTLAETASTFGEMILSSGMLANPGTTPEQKALILDMETGHGAIYLMDIPVRFEFECAMYEERSTGELTVSRLKELMVESQRKVFGDVLEKGGEDPMFWASKLHFYITGVTFYNFPYTFGFLLSRGLFAMFEAEGPEFLPRYEEFLRLTGSDTAPNVAKKTIGQDLESPEFWVEGIRTLQKPHIELEELMPEILPKLEII